MDCIDLKSAFGKRFKVGWDEARAEYGKGARTNDPWLRVVLCQHGHIYPHGGRLLGFASRVRGPVANRVAAVDGAEVVQDCDDGVNVTFPVEQFEAVAAIVGARKRRRLTAAQRAASVERLRRWRVSH